MDSKEYYRENKSYFSRKAKEYRDTLEGKSKCLYASCRRADKIKGFEEPNITSEQIMNLIQKPCHWCGQINWKKNGLDRIDNSKGHDVDNVVCSCWDCNHKREIKELMRPIKQYTIDGVFVKEYENAYEASKELGVKTPSIYNSCKLNCNRKSSKGYLWCYSGDEESIKEKIELYKNRQHIQKPILQCTIEGEIIAEFESMNEAERITGTAHSGISKCCNGKQKMVNGFKWKYKD